MGAQLGTSSSFSDLNLTPLIDVVLVVLIIMMVSIPIQTEEMGVKLPSQSDSPPPQTDTPPEQLVISVYEDGQFALNRRLMTEDVLFDEVTRRLRSMTKKNVFVDGDPDLEYTKIIDMVDLAREAGAAKVGFAKLKENGPSPATSVHSGALPRGVSFGNPTVVGTFSAKYADSVLAPYAGNVRACYEAGLAAQPGLSGRVKLKVTIGPDGTQKDMSEPIVSTSTLSHEGVESCLVDIAKALEFSEKPPGGTTGTALVYFPMLFSPG